MYQLKRGVESFEVVDGPYAGRKYKRGKAYADIPPEEKAKFEKTKEPAPVDDKSKTDKPVKKRGGDGS